MSPIRISLERDSARGLSRYCSSYLLSAFLMLIGGALTMSGDSDRWGSLSYVASTQVLYELSLLVVLTAIHRRARVEEAMLLLGILALFVFDASLVQERYGWDEPHGVLYAVVGAAAGLFLAAGAGFALALETPLVVSAILAVLFQRFAPLLLVDAGAPVLSQSSRYVLVGWLLAATLIPALLARRRLGLLTLVALPVVWGASLLHVAHAGGGVLPFHLAYLAPFLILLSPALERVYGTEGPNRRRLVDALPLAGLALAASALSPSLIDRPWARAMALSPLFLCLLLATAIYLRRALASGRDGLWLLAGLTASLSILGGDLPEILARLVWPTPVQAAIVLLVAWLTIRNIRSVYLAILLHTLPSALLASLLTREAGLPRFLTYTASIGWALLVMLRGRRESMPVALRLGFVGALAVVPVAFALVDPGARPLLVVAAVQCALLVVAGWTTRDRLFLAGGGASAALGAALLYVRHQWAGETPVGHLLIQAAFLWLLLGFLSSVHGDAIRGWLRRLVREGSQEA